MRVRVNEAIQKAQDEPWCPEVKGEQETGKERLFKSRGLCPLQSVVQGLEWVKSGDEWNKCYQ